MTLLSLAKLHQPRAILVCGSQAREGMYLRHNSSMVERKALAPLELSILARRAHCIIWPKLNASFMSIQ